MKNILLTIVLFFPLFLVAEETPVTLFVTAKTAYDANNFEKALEAYQQIEKQNIESFELYYNIGNCYYKQNKIANAIQYYSKSLKIQPNNVDAKNNLKFAYLKTRDKIEPQEELFLNRWWKSIYNSNTSNNWAWTALTAFILFNGSLVLFLIAQSEGKRKLFFFNSLVLFVLTFSTFVFSYYQYKYTSTQSEAVILNNSVSIKSAPTLNATNLFILHEGTIVSIIEKNENWIRIQLDNQKEGWLNINEILFI